MFSGNKSLSLIQASSCSLFYPLQPMISALLGSLLLGEIINLRFICGALLIIFGIIYSVFSDSRQPLTKNSVPSNYNLKNKAHSM
ncbi:EamA family transporter [Clostridium butyricum]|uniref:EamA family transporter n=1 Tax=Clostridium butyricum TaxID=1492 RepID=UPI001CC40CD3|nr:EamA family transporter [Clostridium butyricum]MBZ5746555.1 EamA family transporter [Clostridium butyricum]MDU3594568.1 EamA family transporter [Clostridium butyricum]